MPRGVSAKTVTRLKADWWADYEAWQKRGLGNRRFLYIWADGVYFKPRMAEEKQCVLVIVGADEYGHKELLAMTDGFRESTQSWRELLLDLKRRGLKQDPKLAIGDGALGFWTALREVFASMLQHPLRLARPSTRWRRRSRDQQPARRLKKVSASQPLPWRLRSS